MATRYDVNIKLEQVGNSLRSLRHAKNQKIETVHLATGISASTISEIENGKHLSVTMDTLSKLSAHYGSSLNEILTSKENR